MISLRKIREMVSEGESFFQKICESIEIVNGSILEIWIAKDIVYQFN
jgi:chemotaxis regulatin CheY-phosphate phosphatase CheZ